MIGRTELCVCVSWALLLPSPSECTRTRSILPVEELLKLEGNISTEEVKKLDVRSQLDFNQLCHLGGPLWASVSLLGINDLSGAFSLSPSGSLCLLVSQPSFPSHCGT